MRKVRYFVSKVKVVGNRRIPEVVECFDLLPVSWSAVYYPSLQEAEECCVRMEYDEKILEKLQKQLDWIKGRDFPNELREKKHWDRVKDKFRKDMWRDGTDEIL